MTIADYTKLLDRDLGRLRQEIEAYPIDAALWAPSPGAGNPAGNLCQHLCGNLREYVGRLLGNVAYQRDRPAEFAARQATRDELLALIDETRAGVIPALTGVDPSAPYPVEVLGYPMSAGYFLIHLLGHFNYHLGQIDAHRRAHTGQGALKFVS